MRSAICPVRCTISPSTSNPPVVTIGQTAINYIAQASPVLVACDATASEQNVTLAGSTLGATLSNGGGSDRLTIVSQGAGAAQVSVAGSTLSYGGIVVGTSNSGGAGYAPLIVSFNSNATTEAVQAVLQSLGYSNTSACPADFVRTLQISLTDAFGNRSAPVTRSVQPIDIPILMGAVNYLPMSAPIAVAPTAVLADPNAAYANSVLNFTLINGGASDKLSVISQGTGAGQIGVSGDNITYGGVIVATFTGGTLQTPLVITFNSSATQAAIQTVARSVAYQNASSIPSLFTRTLQITLTDGRESSAPAGSSRFRFSSGRFGTTFGIAL